MRDDKGEKRIKESFENKPFVFIVGLLCGLYFVCHFTGVLEGGFAAKILPPFKDIVYYCFGAVVFVVQILAWKRFRHFEGKWYRDLKVFIYFLSEFFLLTFTVAFLSWPVYGALLFLKVVPPPKVFL